MSQQTILSGRLVKHAVSFDAGSEVSVSKVRVEVGNGRHFHFVEVFSQVPNAPNSRQFDFVLETKVKLRDWAFTQTDPLVDIIPSHRALESFQRFVHLSDLAGDDRLLDEFVAVSRQAPQMGTIAKRKNTKAPEGLELKRAVKAYHADPNPQNAEAVILTYRTCPNKE